MNPSMNLMQKADKFRFLKPLLYSEVPSKQICLQLTSTASVYFYELENVTNMYGTLVFRNPRLAFVKAVVARGN